MNKKEISKNCPAKCKDSGACYGKAVFLGKPGKPKKCNFKCKFILDRTEKKPGAEDQPNKSIKRM